MADHSAVLAAGLRWLYDTEQPEGAILTHFGILVTCDHNRRFGFTPSGWDDNAVVVVNVATIEWVDKPNGDRVASNPLDPDELTTLSAALADLGAEVARTWNGHPATTGSIALKRAAHPSLLAAVERYHAGCPDHPHESVFCRCGWYQKGRALLIGPTLPEPHRAW